MFIFNSTPLYVLDICEVCGSFQCPYCPYYSAAPPVTSKFAAFNVIVSLAVSVYFHRLRLTLHL